MFKITRGERLFISVLDRKAQGTVLGMCRVLQALTEDVCTLLLALNNVKEHPCITFFLQKAFPELQVSLCTSVSHLTVDTRKN